MSASRSDSDSCPGSGSATIALESVDRYQRVDVPALDLELTIVDTLGDFFGRAGLVGVDTREQRYLIAKRDGASGIRIERWTGTTYRTELHAGPLEATDSGADAVVPSDGSERVRLNQRVTAGV